MTSVTKRLIIRNHRIKPIFDGARGGAFESPYGCFLRLFTAGLDTECRAVLYDSK